MNEIESLDADFSSSPSMIRIILPFDAKGKERMKKGKVATNINHGLHSARKVDINSAILLKFYPVNASFTC